MPTTLLAVTGLSPAIVTETLWVLARQENPILPEHVTFLTTTSGAIAIEEQLFTPRVEHLGQTLWENLRQSLHARPDQLIANPPQIISHGDGTSGRALPLSDIRTPAENQATAEFIFSQVWAIVRDPKHRLIASIAGGRKTMGALLHSAITLIGREDDLVTHVLVDPPFDTLPGFYYPDQHHSPLLARDGSAYDPSAAILHLATVPFVPLRNRFKELDDLPGSFLTLRDELSKRLKKDADTPSKLHLDFMTCTLQLDGKTYPLRQSTLTVLYFILLTNQKNSIPSSQQQAVDALNKWLPTQYKKLGHLSPPTFDTDAFRRELNHLRTLLKKANWQPALRTLRQPPFTLTTTFHKS